MFVEEIFEDSVLNKLSKPLDSYVSSILNCLQNCEEVTRGDFKVV